MGKIISNDYKGCAVCVGGEWLCTDGAWRSGCPDNVKYYKTMSRAVRYGLAGRDGTAYALYGDDCIDSAGHLVRASKIYRTGIHGVTACFSYLGRIATAVRADRMG
jgi:hypothetical protein